MWPGSQRASKSCVMVCLVPQVSQTCGAGDSRDEGRGGAQCIVDMAQLQNSLLPQAFIGRLCLVVFGMLPVQH